MDHTINLLGRNKCLCASGGNCLFLASRNGGITRGACRHRIILSRFFRSVNISTRATAGSTYGVRRIVDSRAFGTMGGLLHSGWRVLGGCEWGTAEQGGHLTTFFVGRLGTCGSRVFGRGLCTSWGRCCSTTGLHFIFVLHSRFISCARTRDKRCGYCASCCNCQYRSVRLRGDGDGTSNRYVSAHYRHRGDRLLGIRLFFMFKLFVEIFVLFGQFCCRFSTSGRRRGGDGPVIGAHCMILGLLARYPAGRQRRYLGSTRGGHGGNYFTSVGSPRFRSVTGDCYGHVR